MFQTELNHFLQSFDHPLLRWFMIFITATGYEAFYIFIVIVLMFGVSLKRSFIIVHMLLWTGLLVSYLKDYFALPRPENVDSSLKVLVDEFNGARPFQKQGGKSFFSLPSQQSIDYFRLQHIDSFGFPSGHVSGATVFWGGVALFFRQQWLRGTGLLMVLMMPFSRMYLGRHFLADVLGGMLIGLLTVVLAWYFLIRKKNGETFIKTKRFEWNLSKPMMLFLGAGLLFPLTISFTGNEIAARFFAFNLGFLFIGLDSFPTDNAPVLHRIYRVMLAIAIISLSGIALKYAFSTAGYESQAAETFRKGLETFLLVWGTTLLSRKFGWYREHLS